MRLHRSILILAILFFVFVFMLSSVSTVKASLSVTVSADVHVVSSTPDTNYGVENGLSVFNAYEEYGNAYTWLKFEIPSVKIKSAILYLKHVNYYGDGNPIVTIHVGSSAWAEMGITWNNQPSYGSAFDSVQITEVETWYSWTVTSKIEAGQTVSFVLKTSTSEAIAQFYSKEWGYAGATAKPHLRIDTYEAGEEGAKYTINFFNLPIVLGAKLGVGAFAGGLICSTILLMMTILPVTIINRSRRGGGGIIAELITGLVVLGVCVGITWFPMWIYMVLVLIIILMFSDQIKGKVGN